MSEPHLVANEALSRTLAAFSPPQLAQLLRELKPLVSQNPAQARSLLVANPDLAYAVVQSLVLMGLVDRNALEAAAPQPSEPQQPKSEPAAQKLAALAPDQQAMVRQVLALSEEQVSLLPAEQQGPIRQLREQYS